MAKDYWDQFEAVEPKNEGIALPTENKNLDAKPDIENDYWNQFDEPTQEDIDSILNSNKEVPSKLESGARGAAQGLSFGFAPEITGGLEALKDIATTEATLSDYPELYRQHESESDLAYKKAHEANPAISNIAEFGSGMLIPGSMGIKVLKGGGSTIAKILKGIATGGLSGGLSSAGNSKAELIGSDKKDQFSKFGEDVLGGTLLGGTIGGVIPVAGAGASKLMPKITNSKYGSTLKNLKAKIGGDVSVDKINEETVDLGYKRIDDFSDKIENIVDNKINQRQSIIDSNKKIINIDDAVDNLRKKTDPLLNRGFTKKEGETIFDTFPEMFKGKDRDLVPGELIQLENKIEDLITSGKAGTEGNKILIPFKREIRNKIDDNIEIKSLRSELGDLRKLENLTNREKLKTSIFSSEDVGKSGFGQQDKINQINKLLKKLDPSLHDSFKDDLGEIRRLGLVRDTVANPLFKGMTLDNAISRTVGKGAGLITRGMLKVMPEVVDPEATVTLMPKIKDNSSISKLIDYIKPNIKPDIIRELTKPEQERTEYSLPISNRISSEAQKTQDPELKGELNRIQQLDPEKQSVEYFKLQSNEKFRKLLNQLKEE